MTPVAAPCTVSGLTAGTTYYFAVRGVGSGVVIGPMSGPSAAITAIDLPGTPDQPTVTIPSALTMQVAWTGPTPTISNPVRSFRVLVSVDGSSFSPVAFGTCTSPTASPCTVEDLTAGTSYQFEIVAVNPAGSGAASTASAP